MSEVDKSEIIAGAFTVSSYIITIYVAYRIAKRDKKVGIRVILSWFSILLAAEIFCLFIIALLIIIFSLDEFLPDIFIGLVMGYYMYSFALLPFFIILWIYNIISYIEKKEDPI